MEKEPWEIEFDEQFVKDLGSEVEPVWKDPIGCVGPVKTFIRTQREQAKREERAKILQAYRQCTGIQDDIFTKSL